MVNWRLLHLAAMYRGAGGLGEDVFACDVVENWSEVSVGVVTFVEGRVLVL